MYRQNKNSVNKGTCVTLNVCKISHEIVSICSILNSLVEFGKFGTSFWPQWGATAAGAPELVSEYLLMVDIRRHFTMNSSPERHALLAPQVRRRKNKSSSRQETVTSWHTSLSESTGFEAMCSVFHGKEIKSAQWVRLKQTFLRRVGQKMSLSQTSSWVSAERSGPTVTSHARRNIFYKSVGFIARGKRPKEMTGHWKIFHLSTFTSDQSGFFSTRAAGW